MDKPTIFTTPWGCEMVETKPDAHYYLKAVYRENGVSRYVHLYRRVWVGKSSIGWELNPECDREPDGWSTWMGIAIDDGNWMSKGQWEAEFDVQQAC